METNSKLKQILCKNCVGRIFNAINGESCDDWTRDCFHPEIVDNEIYCVCNIDASAPKSFRCALLDNANPIKQISIIAKLMKEKK